MVMGLHKGFREVAAGGLLVGHILDNRLENKAADLLRAGNKLTG